MLAVYECFQISYYKTFHTFAMRQTEICDFAVEHFTKNPKLSHEYRSHSKG